MNPLQKLGLVLRSLAMIFGSLIAVSVIDILVVTVNVFSYSTALFIVLFGIGGIFGAGLGYISSTEKVPRSDRITPLWVVVMQVIIGLLFFFLIARIEGGEYEVPFKAFGLMLALTSLVFIGKKRKAGA